MVSCLFKGETVSTHPPSWPAELGNNQDYTLCQRRWSEGSQTKAADISTPESVKPVKMARWMVISAAS